MNFAFSSNAFRNFTLEKAIQDISHAGFKGVEIMCDTPHAWPPDLDRSDIKAIKTAIKRHGLAISNLNAFMMCKIKDFHHPSWIEQNKEYRKLRIDHTLACLDLAAELDAPTISTEPGGPVQGMAKDEALALFTRGLETVLPRAEHLGVTLLVEPEPDLLLETSDDYLDFASNFSSQALGLNLDVGHFYCAGEDPVEVIEKLMDHTCHIHLEDIAGSRKHHHLELGDGAMNIPAIIKAIDRSGYQGFVTVELYPFLSRPAATARRAREYLTEMCGYE